MTKSNHYFETNQSSKLIHHNIYREITKYSQFLEKLFKYSLQKSIIMETKTQTISLAYLLVLMASSMGIQVVVSSAIVSTATATPNNSMTIIEDNQVISVPTTSGVLQGTKQSLNHQTTGSNNSIYKFLSVPYAEAPIGSLRFKRPVEIKQERVNSVIDASKFTKTCPQYRHLTQFISPLLNIDNEHQTSEDCLHLHVYVPSSVGSLDNNNKLEPSKQLPVIVWIPGEGFDFADARQFDGSYLAHKTQSIVVSVQYRVGVLGFLYAPKMNVTGNMGIHDQLMALKWVKQNIAAFGGDSDRVTLMGRFSGSMSISVMVTAPKQDLIKLNGQQTLFNRVALLSGVAVNGWIIDRQQEDRLKGLEKEAINKGFCTNSQVNDNTCLEQISTENLFRISNYGWRLVIDDELVGETSPIDAIKSNQFNSNLEAVLIGETGMEGTLCLYRHMLDTKNDYAQIIEEEKLTRKVLHEIIEDDSKTYYQYNANSNKTTNPILDTLKSMAENRNYHRSSSKLRDEYLDACSAYMIKSHSNRFKRSIMIRNNLAENRMDSSKKPVEVYHYELKYKPTFSLAPEYIKTAAHGDDIPLIFGLIYNQPRQLIDGADLLMTRKMMAYIGNFVHGNNPLINQQTVDSDNETSSMDENESINLDENNNNSNLIQGVLVKSSWSNEGQIHTIDFNKNDSNEISHPKRSQSLNSTPTDGFIETINPTDDSSSKESSHLRQSPRIYLRGDRSNIRVIVVESPQADMRTTQQSLFDIIERKNHQRVESGSEQLSTTNNGHSQNQYEQLSATKSQRMLELHRQQMVEDNFWIQNSKRHPLVLALPGQQQQPQQQISSAQPTTMTLVNESSFMTMLVFSSCIVIFTLISLCLGLCLVIFRSNLTANKGIQHYASTSSSCNICDDSQGSSIEAVLNGHRKDGARGFSNVFEKLRNHNVTRTSSHPQSNQCTSTTSTINNQRINKTDMVVSTNQQQLSDGVVITNNPQQQQQQGSC